VNAAALMGGVEDPARGSPEPLVVVGDDQLHQLVPPIDHVDQPRTDRVPRRGVGAPTLGQVGIRRPRRVA